MRDLLARQRRLQIEAFAVDPRELTGEDRVEYVRMNVLALVDEAMEVLHHVDGWKNWQTDRSSAGEIADLQAYIGEGVDLLHFVANLLNVAGVEDDALDHLFARKQKLNARRQAEGYAGNGAAFDVQHPQETA